MAQNTTKARNNTKTKGKKGGEMEQLQTGKDAWAKGDTIKINIAAPKDN